MNGWFNALMVAPKGVLFENEYLQVGVKQAYQQSQCRLTLFFGNKAPAAMEELVVETPVPAYLRCQAQPVPSRLEPKSQHAQNHMIEAMLPFDGAPELKVAFVCNGQRHAYQLRLPVVTSSFFDPLPLQVRGYYRD